MSVSARLSNGHATILTIPGEAVAPGKRLVIEKVILEDLLKNGDAVVKYDFIGMRTD